MRLAIEVAGRLRHVHVDRSGGGFAVAVDDRVYHVDARRIDAQTLSLVVDTMSRQSYEAVVVPGPSGSRLTVTVGGVPVAVALNGRGRFGRGDDRSASSSGPQRLSATMPGKIVRVLVKPGDTVRLRQPLVVVEAMKMENEMRAGRDGTVAEVHAREGHSVETGALLLVIQ
jgi:biotin carboxyl carrier protein